MPAEQSIETINGGVNWAALGSPINSRLTDVDFVTTELGWALSFEGELIKTTNGAACWQVLPTPVELVCGHFSFIPLPSH